MFAPLALGLSLSLLSTSLQAAPPAPGPSPAPVPAPAPLEPHQLLNVDLRDLEASLPEAAAVVQAMKLRPIEFFPQDVTYADVGVGSSSRSVLCQVNRRGWVKRKRADAVFGVELVDTLQYQADGSVELTLLALFHSKRQGNTLTFRKLAVRLQGSPLSVTAVRVLQDLPVEQTRFQLEVGLLDRKAVLTDEANGIKKIYPLGVGGFDEGIQRRDRKVGLLTPLFKDAKLKRSRAIQARGDHDYYCGMPFLRVTNSAGRDTAIGLHIIQHPKMVRGFDSHGCVRLREKDLYEVTGLLLKQSESEIPLNVRYRLGEPQDHPYALTDNRYQSVVNCSDARWKPESCFEGVDPARRPRLNGRRSSCKDSHGLTLTREYACRPPVEKLVAEPGVLAAENQLGQGEDTSQVYERDSLLEAEHEHGQESPEWLEQVLESDGGER